MEFDTDNPNNEEAAPQIGAILQPMIGESITMTYNDANELTSFSGMEALRDKITKAVGWSMHWEQMKDEFNDEQGKIQWGELPLAALPNRNAVVGDTWDKSYSFDAGHMGTIITDHHFTVSDIKTQQDRPIVEIASKVENCILRRTHPSRLKANKARHLQPSMALLPDHRFSMRSGE